MERISRKKEKAKEKEKAREKERAVTVKTVRIVEFPVIQRTFAGNRRNQKQPVPDANGQVILHVSVIHRQQLTEKQSLISNRTSSSSKAKE